MKNIYVLDPVCINNSHYAFNLSILKNHNLIKLNTKVSFSCYESNTKIINLCKKTGINVSPVKEHSSYIRRVFIFFYKSFYSKSLLKSDKIILFAIDNTLLPLLFLLNFFLFPFLQKKITIISHNNLYAIKKSNLKRIIMKLFLILYQPKVVLLSPSLSKEFGNILKYNNIFTFFHQNYRNEVLKSISLIKGVPLINSPIVILVSSGHSANFIDMVKANFDSIKALTSQSNNKVIIKYISKVPFEITEINSILFELADKPIDMVSYYEMILNVDYVLFPKDEIANTRASGVLMDTLSVGTNFIAPDVGHFKDININYDIGFLYKDHSELFHLINKLSEKKRSNNLKQKNINNLYKDTDSTFLSNFLFNI
jgi:hypothetical protein